MRIRNLSSVPLPVSLWHGIADEMKVGSSLPKALNEEIGLYGSLNARGANANFARFQRLAASLVALEREKVLAWRPKRE